LQDRKKSELRAIVAEVTAQAGDGDWVSLVKSFDRLVKQSDKLISSTKRFSGFYIRALKCIDDAVESTYADKEIRKSLSTTASKSLSALRQRLVKYLKVVSLDLSTISTQQEEDDSASESEPDIFDDDVAADKKDNLNGKNKDFILYADRKDVTFEMIDEKLKDIIACRGKKGTDRHVAVRQLTYMATLAKCPAQEVEILLHIISAQFDTAGSMSTHMSVSIWRSCMCNVLRLIELLRNNTHITLLEKEEHIARPARDDLLAGAPVQLCGSLCAFAERLDDEYMKSLQHMDPHTKEYISRLRDECFVLMFLQQVLTYYNERELTVPRMKIAQKILGHLYCKTPSMYEAVADFASNRLNNINELIEVLPSEMCESNYDQMFCSDAGEEHGTDSGDDWFPRGFSFPRKSLQELISELTFSIYEMGDDRSKVRAILYDTFNTSLRGEFELAREQLLMSHLQESIHHMDIETQVLFNRCMAQMGLSAFQKGYFHEARACLTDILSSGRARELLAQGVSVSRHAAERNFEQEKLERRRQVPFHMHINIELLESIYLVSCMLGETHSVLDKPRHLRSVNRTFLRMIEGFEKQTFNGPPEGVRDTVMCATKYLIDGEWASAAHCVKSMSIWTLLPGLEGSASVLDLVVEEIKQEALRTFIFQRASQYDTLCLDTLSDMFALSVESVQANVSKLLTTGGLTGSCDAPTSTFAVHTLEPSTLQSAVTLLAENVAVFLDANERALGIRVESDTATAFEDEDLGSKHRGYRNSQYEDREVNKLKKSRSVQGKYSRQKLVISAGERDSRGRKQDARDRLRGELLQFSGGKFI